MQVNNMDIKNIEDYYISVEHLNNFTDYNINNWIDSGNKEKIMNKLDQIYKTGRSFTSNGYQATSTDPVFTPFCFEQNGKGVIEYVETRHVFYFPALYDVVVKQSVPEKVQREEKNDSNKSKLPKEEKNSKKRKLPMENKEPLTNENKSPEKKKRKFVKNSTDENLSKVTLEINKKEPVKKELKSPEPNKINNSTTDLDNKTNIIAANINKTGDNCLESKKVNCNGSIDLDNHVNTAENCDNKTNVIFQIPEIKKHKKKSKEKNYLKSEPETPNNQSNESDKQIVTTPDLNGEIKKKHKKKSKKSVDGEINVTEPVENVISNGNTNPEKKKKKKKSAASNELSEVKQEKIVEESSVKIENLPKLDVKSEDVKKQKKQKKRKHSEEEVVVEVKKEKSHKKSKKHNNNTDNN